KTSASAKGKGTENAADAGEGFDSFDAQLDAALPDSDEPSETGTPKPAGKNSGAAEQTTDGKGERTRDQVAAAGDLTPRTFMQPVEVAPVKDDAAGAADVSTIGASATTDAAEGAPAQGDVTAAGTGIAASNGSAPGRTVGTTAGKDLAAKPDVALATDAA